MDGENNASKPSSNSWFGGKNPPLFLLQHPYIWYLCIDITIELCTSVPSWKNLPFITETSTIPGGWECQVSAINSINHIRLKLLEVLPLFCWRHLFLWNSEKRQWDKIYSLLSIRLSVDVLLSGWFCLFAIWKKGRTRTCVGQQFRANRWWIRSNLWFLDFTMMNQYDFQYTIPMWIPSCFYVFVCIMMKQLQVYYGLWVILKRRSFLNHLPFD